MPLLDDTSPGAREVYLRRLAEMTPSERVNLAVALWEASRQLERAGMRQQYPDADEDEITFRIAVRRFGAELAREAYRRE